MSILTTLFSQQPAIRDIQVLLLIAAVVAVYLVFFTTRDIILRSKSTVMQVFSIVLVAGLPIVGFFLYLLFRPGSTVREREAHAMLKKLTHK